MKRKHIYQLVKTTLAVIDPCNLTEMLSGKFQPIGLGQNNMVGLSMSYLPLTFTYCVPRRFFFLVSAFAKPMKFSRI